MNRKTALTLVTICLLAAACGPGGLTATPSPTATASPTLAPAPTDTPSSTATLTATSAATATAIQTLPPTAVTCPKGTAFNPTVGLCFYATRTPKPVYGYCEVFTNHTACTSHGCTWVNLTKTCKP